MLRLVSWDSEGRRDLHQSLSRSSDWEVPDLPRHQPSIWQYAYPREYCFKLLTVASFQDDEIPTKTKMADYVSTWV